MIAALVLFHRQEVLPREEAVRAFETTAPRYRGVPGLRFKAYLRAEVGADLGGVYLWESREAAERFYSPEWRRAAAERYGVEPEIRYFEVPLTVDNGLGAAV